MKYQAQALHIHDNQIQQQKSCSTDRKCDDKGYYPGFDIHVFLATSLCLHKPPEECQNQYQHDDEQGRPGMGKALAPVSFFSHPSTPLNSACFDQEQWTSLPLSGKAQGVDEVEATVDRR